MDGLDGLRSTPFRRNERWDDGGTPSLPSTAGRRRYLRRRDAVVTSNGGTPSLSSTAGRRRYSNAMVTGPKRPDGSDSRSKGRSILS